MKKISFFIITLTVCIVASLYLSNQNVYALGDNSGTIRSCGNIVFESENGTINLVSGDIAYLQDKLSSIPTDVYDPGYYTHLHEWVFEDITESTHSRKCRVCGEIMSNSHIPCRQEKCDLLYDGKTYEGSIYTCECGQQWMREVSHNLFYSQKDDKGHLVKCILENTEYCSGLSEQEEPHSINLTSKDDGKHHYLRCNLCNYETEQECDFNKYTETGDNMIGNWYCECGNSQRNNEDINNPTELESGLVDQKITD